jgi:DNA polymerase III alpha subunit
MARTKKQPSKGLGDTIEKITEATGIKKAVEIFAKATGIDCGCEERKTKLNNLIPYRRKVNCLNESDYNQLTEFLKPNKGSLTPNEQWTIAAIYERVFEIKLQHSNCASCWRYTLSDLRKVYNEYKVND